ncbi:MAG: 30S ribosome-binding factor RbfA [Eubacteriaceae bacterium]|nr:30S ribosome-binding factor RbfA [Eubacteriaceae bacterium]
MATKHRIEKINELIRTQISETVSYGLKDPRLENVIVGVSRVNTTPDMKYCKVYFNIYTGDDEQAGEIMGVLEKAKGYIRKQVSDALTTRYSPELTFILDDSYKQYDHINEILKDLDIRQEDEI